MDKALIKGLLTLARIQLRDIESLDTKEVINLQEMEQDLTVALLKEEGKW